MALSWTDDMSVGDDLVDHQHQEILSLIARMSACAKKPAAQDAAFPAMTALLACLDEHFAEEERQMLDIRYAGADAHRREHDAMARTLRTLRASVRTPADLIRVTITILPRWVASHQASLDRDLCHHAAVRLGITPRFHAASRF